MVETFEEFEFVSDITHTNPRAKIYCIVSGIPQDMKKGLGSSYFDGKLSDNNKSIRVYGYDPGVRRKLFDPQSEEAGMIIIAGCYVKNAKGSTKDLEVFVNKQATITKSDKVFTAPMSTIGIPTPINDICDFSVNTFFAIKITVCTVDDLQSIPSKCLTCQKRTIADSSGST